MELIKKGYNAVSHYYRDINPSSLSGAIDVVVVRQKDGTYRSSPFHVRFGKTGVFKPKNKVIEIEINGEQVALTMKLGEAGVAYFDELKSNLEEDQKRHQKDSASDTQAPESLTATTLTSKPIISSEPINIEPRNHTISPDTKCEVRSEGYSSTPPHIKITSSLDESRLNNVYEQSEAPCLRRDSHTADEQDSLNAATNMPHTIQLGNLIISDCTSLGNESKSSDSLNNLNCVRGGATGNGLSYFSDGDLTPELRSPVISRPTTPKSDSEIDKMKGGDEKEHAAVAAQNSHWKWGWGQLPEPADATKLSSSPSSVSEHLHSSADLTVTANGSQAASPTSSPKTKQEKSKFLSGILSRKKNEHPADGVYLDEAEKLDAEVAASYFNQKTSLRPISMCHQMTAKDDDQESALGSSATQSPLRDYSILGDVQVSLCGLGNAAEQPTAKYEELFHHCAVTFDRFVDEIHSIATNPNLVVKINNRYLSWPCAAPIILSALVYHKALPNEVINQVIEANTPAKAAASVQQSIKPKASPEATPATLTAASIASTAQVVPGSAVSQKAVSESKTRNWLGLGFLNKSQKTSTASATLNVVTVKEEIVDISEMKVSSEAVPKDDKDKEKDKDKAASASVQEARQSVPEDKYIRTTRLSSDSIAKLNLKPGLNEIAYSITTMMQGTARIESLIFLWDHDDKIVVSDIDGTITRSDALGQILPLINLDWSQAGVADLFTAIEKNSYKFMYLSARAIGQTSLTRDMLRKINQNGIQLPEGPLLVNPVSLFRAFHKEVIEKRPQDFKISCLNDIKSLFPVNHNTFYAGYGNRTNDVESYLAVGIEKSRIFTINPKGELKHEASQTMQLSYASLMDYVEQIFPPLNKNELLNAIEYSSFIYWKDPLPKLDEMENKESKSSSKADEEILF